ncbi:hypothetical protein CF335_g9754, partial [Tilletia laevis]
MINYKRQAHSTAQQRRSKAEQTYLTQPTHSTLHTPQSLSISPTPNHPTMANNNDSIFNCTFSGEIQVDSIEKEGQNKYNNLKVTFPLGLEPDLDIDAKATAFGVQSAEPPIVANITAGFTTGATPKLTIQRYTHLYDAESEPPDYTIPCPKISGVGRVTHIDEANKAIQFVTAAWCRE